MANPQIISDGLHTAGAVVSAEEARLSQAAAWARASTGVGARTGVVYAGVSTLVTATATTAPSMTVSVPALHAVCQKANAEGVYVVSSAATQLPLIAAAPGSNSRIDVVYVMQMDTASTTSPDASTQAVISVVTGTAAASPVKPAIPVGAVELGTVTVPAGATATTGCTVATTAQWTALHGAPIPVRNSTERGAITQYNGLRVDRLDLGYIERSDGTNWTPTVDVFNGSEGTMVGGAPAAGVRKQYRTGSAVTAVAGSGNFAFTWAGGAFANGVVSMIAVPGDTSGNVSQIAVNQGSSTLSAINGFAYQPNGTVVANGANIRINYTITGW